MKTYGRLFEQLVSFDNLHASWRAARRGKRARSDVARFEIDCEKEILDLRRELIDGEYAFGRYRTFTVQEPRERLVAAAPFRDRIVHHALVRVLDRVYEPRFVRDTYACRVGRGTHRAVLRCQKFVRRYPLCLKVDLWKFFPSVDHEILLGILDRNIRDARFQAVVKDVVGSWESGPEYYRAFPGDDLFSVLRPRGIPIGNLTSQFFGNLILSDLDHFVKRTLKADGYLRYMDDLLLFARERETLRGWKQEITAILEPLRLTPHPTKCQILHTDLGVPFLGFRVFRGKRLLLAGGVRRFVRRTRRRIRAVERGNLDPAAVDKSVRAWVAHASFGDTSGLRKKILPRLVRCGKGGGPHMARVLRGGSWNNETSNLRCAQRNNNNPTNRNSNNGFRCAKTLPAGASVAAATGGERSTSTARSRSVRAEQ